MLTANRRLERQSNRNAQEIEELTKFEAKFTLTKMINSEIKKILEYEEDGFVSRKPWKNFSESFKALYLLNNGYKTVVNNNEATTASIISLCAINNVLGDK